MKSKSFVRIVVMLLLIIAFLSPQRTIRAGLLYVSTTMDILDAAGGVCGAITAPDLPGPDGYTSLREALCFVNNNEGPDTIGFALDDEDPHYNALTGVWTFSPATRLPGLNNDGTTINGFLQDGSSHATETTPATLVIEINGSSLSLDAFLLNSGFNILSANNVIKGLVINNFPVNGITIAGNNAISNTISGTYIGTNFDGTLDEGNAFDGVFIGYGAKNNLIGGDSSAERNVLSGNDSVGVSVFNGNLEPATATTGNVIAGNYIGTKSDGISNLGNSIHGVHIYGGAQSNFVGGETTGTNNLIKGNRDDGIRIRGEGTDFNVILGNRILDNGDNGVQITFDAQNNTVGGSTPGARNQVSLNDEIGIVITGTQTMSNTVLGNYIGTDFDGEGASGNGDYGVAIMGGANHNYIGGGSDQDAYNIISGNESPGVLLADPGTSQNTIAGNFIGTDISGTNAVGNEDYGVHIISGASENMIGGDQESAFNLISGNIGKGVFIYGPDAHGNTIAGNYIGTDITGSEVISNTRGGVLINNGAYENVIGGDTSGQMNLISGNDGIGVMIELESHNNSILGNYIGTDITGLEALGNKYNGVAISRSANTRIGGSSPGEGNLISGNGYSGVTIDYEESTGNFIVGNQIGTDKTGTAALPNTYGVFIGDGASENTIGGTTPGARNLISGNKLAGVSISGEGTSDNVVAGNYLGTDITGLNALKNREGVYITSGAQNNTIGGESEASRNVISGNRESGVSISGDTSTGNVVVNNYIGVAANGINALGNTSGGFYISGSDNVIGPGNIIAFNWLWGIYVHNENALNNVITQNSIYSNGHEDYYRYGIRLKQGAHGDIQPPEIVDATASGEVRGTAYSNCVIELFWSRNGEGQGEVYLGTTTATGEGDFNLSVTYPGAYNLTATATDERGTSEFSEVYNPVWLLYMPLTSYGD